MNLFALTTRGLESVCAREIAALPGVTITQTAYRRVAFTYIGTLDALLGLRTVDDVFLDVATWSGIGRPRATLTRLRDISAQLDLRAAAATCARLRPLGSPPTFSVTASFVGKRNYTTDEIKQTVAAGIERGHGWLYSIDDATADLNVRIFIEHEHAFVGVRLSKTALHGRPYKHVHLTGSLKPPVAAALVALAGVTSEHTVLDPCCGAGTILAEAGLLGARILGGDLDPAAVAAAQANLTAAGVSTVVRQWDVQALPLADASVDRIVTNLPWGRQVRVDAALATFYRRACAELHRVLAPAGRIVLLTSVPQLLAFDDMRREQQIEISLFGQTPSIVVLTAG